MPRPSAQISLDYQTRVLQPQVMTLLCWLANDGTPFWCREFEELYRAFSGWHEAFRVYDDAVRSRTLMDEEKKDKDWKEEWWSFYCNYAILPTARLRYLEHFLPSQARPFFRGEWVDFALPALPSLYTADKPLVKCSAFDAELTPAQWMANPSTARFPILPVGAAHPPPLVFVHSLGLLAPPSRSAHSLATSSHRQLRHANRHLNPSALSSRRDEVGETKSSSSTLTTGKVSDTRAKGDKAVKENHSVAMPPATRAGEPPLQTIQGSHRRVRRLR